MRFIKVLGIGSPFGDDQAGWKVIEHLKELISKETYLNSNVILEYSDRPGVRLLGLIKGYDTVIIVDAVKSGTDIGSIHRFKKDDIVDSKDHCSTHGLSILQALQIAGALNELPENILFYGIEIDKITSHSTLSHRIKDATEELASQLKNEIVSELL